MKVLLVIREDPPQRFLVTIKDRFIIKEVKDLVGKNKRSKAIIKMLSHGIIESGISHPKAMSLEADLILTQDSASWVINS